MGKKLGRPSDYTAETAARICERLSGGESLRTVCQANGMPAEGTVYRWLHEHSEFRETYARARESQAEFWANEILEISDTPKLGVKTKTGPEGEVEITEGDMIDHRKLQIDTRKWLLSKLLPKKYGDAVTLKGTKEEPIAVTFNV